MYYDAFKKGLKLIWRGLFNFLKKLALVIFFYGVPMIVPMLISLLLLWLLSSISTIDQAVAVLVFKIVATVGQIIPLSIYLGIAENEVKYSDEFSAELGFAFCAAVIAFIWIRF